MDLKVSASRQRSSLIEALLSGLDVSRIAGVGTTSTDPRRRKAQPSERKTTGLYAWTGELRSVPLA